MLMMILSSDQETNFFQYPLKSKVDKSIQLNYTQYSEKYAAYFSWSSYFSRNSIW